MIKLIAIDLDDTLLDTNKDISKENVEAINKAKEKGIIILITTGRPLFRIKGFLETLNLYNKDTYVVTFNGSLITNGIGNQILFNELLTTNDIINITNVFDKYNLCYNVYQDQDIFSCKVLDFIRKQKVFEGIKFINCDIDTIHKLKYANKIIICDEEEKINKYRASIEKDLNNQYTILRSTNIYLEVLSKNASKGIALRNVRELLNIKKEEVMAIGDEENDLPMFDEAGYKIAMKNGSDILKNKATYITDTQNNSGVAKAINKFINE